MAKTAQEVMQLIREQGIKMVDFKMVDINGQYRHVTIPAQNFTEATMTDGIGFDASNYGYAVSKRAIWSLSLTRTPRRSTRSARSRRSR